MHEVMNLFLRNGRRHRSADGTKDLKYKPAAKQRKATLVARQCHPDALEALETIKSGNLLHGQQHLERLARQAELAPVHDGATENPDEIEPDSEEDENTEDGDTGNIYVAYDMQEDDDDDDDDDEENF